MIIQDDIREERVFMKNPEQKPNLIPHALAYTLSLPFVQNKTALELGCGTGYGTKLLAESAAHIIGVDYSKTAIDYALSWKPNNCEFICRDIENDLPLKSYHPEVIVAMQALEHFDKPKEIIDLYRGCLWVFALPNGGETIDHHHHLVDEKLIQSWFGEVQLTYFNDQGNIVSPNDLFTNFFGVYRP